MSRSGVFLPFLYIAFAASTAFGQAVISTHAGVLNFTEGTVLIDDQPVQQKFGSFSNVHENAVLRTEKGRAELLLTPGVFLRLDEQSSLRMISSDLAQPRIEILHGSAIVDSNDSAGKNPLVLIYQGYEIRFPKDGVYRLDSEPGVFETYTGEARLGRQDSPAKTIDESNQFFFGIGTETKKFGEGAVDLFSEWARNRASTITADNQAVSQSTADPGDFGDFDAVPNTSPTVPSFGGFSPSYGTYGGTIFADNGFYPGGPYLNSFFQPVAVIYLVPWWWRRLPPNGTTAHKPGYPPNPVTARRTAYPALPSPASNSFRSNPYQPLSTRYDTPIAGRSSVFNRQILRVPPPIRLSTPARMGVSAPRVYAPAAPRVAAPVRIHR